MRADACYIALLYVFTLTLGCGHEESDTTDTTIPPQARTTTTIVEPPRPYEMVDVCRLLSEEELIRAFDGIPRAAVVKSDTADRRCSFTMTYPNGVVHQYALWLTAPEKSYSKYKGGRGLLELVTPSAQLATIVGSEPLPKAEVTKRVWDYIKSNKLQDPDNQRMINADSRLRTVFGGRKQVSMFEMTAFVNKHLSVGDDEIVHGLGDITYLIPATRDHPWKVYVLKRDKFQLNVVGATRDGVLKVANYIMPKLQL